MKTTAKENLMQLMDLLGSISMSNYTQKIDILSGATIGQHIRHILEFYLLLVSGTFSGTISYDKRKRDIRIENKPSFARETIVKLLKGIETIREDDAIILEGDYTSEGKATSRLSSSAGRELAYCIEHSIHHQAIIKVGLLYLGLVGLTDEHFGVAYSTIRYRNN